MKTLVLAVNEEISGAATATALSSESSDCEFLRKLDTDRLRGRYHHRVLQTKIEHPFPFVARNRNGFIIMVRLDPRMSPSSRTCAMHRIKPHCSLRVRNRRWKVADAKLTSRINSSDKGRWIPVKKETTRRNQ
jgi:hypothetical protein